MRKGWEDEMEGGGRESRVKREWLRHWSGHHLPESCDVLIVHQK